MLKKDEKLETLRESLGTRDAYLETVKTLELQDNEKEILLRASVELKKRKPSSEIIDKAYNILVAKSFIKLNEKDKIMSDKDFFNLDANSRKEALDYLWFDAEKFAAFSPKKPFLQKLLSVVFGITAFSLGALAFIGILNGAKFDGFVIIFALAMFFLFLMLMINSKAKRTEHLKKSAKNFLSNSRVQEWIDTLKKEQIDGGVLNISQSNPEETYVLASEDIEFLSETDMPPKTLSLTYVLVGKYMSVVDKIQIDIKKISYLYVEQDNPSLPKISTSDWNSEEFHYRDIIEIGLKGNEENDVVSHLFISLSSGATKEYPTVKRDTERLFVDVRRRIREAKLN